MLQMADKVLMKNRINREIGGWLRGLRRSQGLTLKAAAERVALKAGTLAKFESGRPIPMSVLARLVAGYRACPEFLIWKIMEIQKISMTPRRPSY